MNGLVLIHGGGHDARCWEPTIDALARRSALPALAVDLPGRGSRPGPLEGMTIASVVAAVVDQIDEAGLDRVTLVGHSMAGLVLPGVAAELTAARSDRVVYVACNVPEAGRSVLDGLPLLVRPFVALAARVPTRGALPGPLASLLFCNGMTRAQRRFVRDQLVPESRTMVRERAQHVVPDDVPSTWIVTQRDRILRPASQRRTAARLGIADVIDIDAPHDAMVSHPDQLAELLLARVSHVG